MILRKICISKCDLPLARLSHLGKSFFSDATIITLLNYYITYDSYTITC